MGEQLTLAYRPSPMSPVRELRVVPHGLTIAEIVDGALPEQWQREAAAVTVQGQPVAREDWGRRPDSGLTVQVIVVPGGSGQDWLRAALIITVIAVAAYTGNPAALAMGFEGGAAVAVGAGITGAITLGGMLAINALVPPESMDLNDDSRRSDTYAITGGRNEIRKFSQVPFVFGEHRMFPPFCATPTFDIVNNDVWFLCMIAWGAGPIDMANIDLKIGDTPIAEFDDVLVEHFAGTAGVAPNLNLYSTSRQETEGGGLMIKADGRVSRTTPVNIVRFTVELVFPRGLIRFQKSGGSNGRTVQFKIESRPAGSTVWYDHGTVAPSAKTSDPVRRTYTYPVTDPLHTGNWDIAVTRLTDNANDPAVADESIWTTIRTYRPEPPVKLEGCAVTALYMRSSGQLSGVTDRINGMPRPIMKDYDVATELWVLRTSSNCASQMIRLLQHEWSEYRATDSKIDWPSFVEWHVYCTERDLRFDFVADFKASRWELMDIIAAAGDATYGFVGGKWRVYVDAPKPLVAHVFSPRNMRNFRSDVIYYDAPDAIRVSFPNADIGYEIDEIIVPADGFTEQTAQRFESMQFPGKVRASEIQRRVRRRLVEAVMRDQTFSWFTDIESLTCEKFDLVIVQHDRILSGVGNGRVIGISLNSNPPGQLAFDLDSHVTIEGGRSYSMAWPSRVTGQVEIVRIRTIVGKSNRITLHEPIPEGSVEIDDMIGVVEVRSTDDQLIGRKALIKEILPEANFGAQIIAVPYREEIYTPDTEPVPEWTSNLTLPPGAMQPVILAVYSDESVAQRLPSGDVALQAVVSLFQNNTQAITRAAALILRWKVDEDGEQWQEIRSSVDTSRIVLSVFAETTIIVQARWEWANGTFGKWTPSFTHEIVGVYIPPPDVEFVFQDGELMRWQGPTDPDHGGYLLRTTSVLGTPWAQAKPLHAGVYTSDLIGIDLLPEAALELLVKAVTMGGVESQAAARAEVNREAMANRHTVVTYDARIENWPGTTSGTEIVAGSLVALATSAMWPDPVAAAWPDMAAAGFVTNWSTVEYQAELWLPSYARSSDVIELQYEIDGPGDIKVQWVSGAIIEWDIDAPADAVVDDTDYPPPDWLQAGTTIGATGAFRPPVSYRGPIRVIEGDTLRIFVTVDGGTTAVRPALHQLKALLRGRIDIEMLGNRSIAVNGTRMPSTTDFRVIIGVNALLVGEGAATTLRVLDKTNPVLGALVAAYNDAETSVEAVADVAIVGT